MSVVSELSHVKVAKARTAEERRARRKAAGRDNKVGYLFLLPWLVGLFVITIGPLLASILLQYFGPRAFFAYTSFIFLGFMIFTLRRMQARPSVPPSERSWRFRSLLRTSAYFNRLAGPPDKDERE